MSKISYQSDYLFLDFRKNSAGTNFKGARTATLNAASAIYGSASTEYSRVAQSWSLVGVY